MKRTTNRFAKFYLSDYAEFTNFNVKILFFFLFLLFLGTHISPKFGGSPRRIACPPVVPLDMLFTRLLLMLEDFSWGFTLAQLELVSEKEF